jgi:hypothetical protein
VATGSDTLVVGDRATTTNGQPVPLPTDWNGIPLVATSAISNDESI